MISSGRIPLTPVPASLEALTTSASTTSASTTPALTSPGAAVIAHKSVVIDEEDKVRGEFKMCYMLVQIK